MLLAIDARLHYALDRPADLLLAVEVAQAPDQRLVEDLLTSWGTGPLTPIEAEDGVGQRTWTRADARFEVHYAATVEVSRQAPDLATLEADPLPGLPPTVVRYLWPSRYCESDRFESWVHRRFGGLTGGRLVAALDAYVGDTMRYVSGVSNGNTTAADSFIQREGVCRDYAHLLIALVRAAGIPARIVGAYGLGVDPPDFHAVVEVWLSGGWHLIDPTRLAPVEGLVRIGVGRDATDVAFLSIFGRAQFVGQSVAVRRIDG